MPNEHFLGGTWHCAICWGYQWKTKWTGFLSLHILVRKSDRINNTISAGALKEIHRVTGQTELDGERGYFRVSGKISRKGGQIGLLAMSTEGMVRDETVGKRGNYS